MSGLEAVARRLAALGKCVVQHHISFVFYFFTLFFYPVFWKGHESTVGCIRQTCGGIATVTTAEVKSRPTRRELPSSLTSIWDLHLGALCTPCSKPNSDTNGLCEPTRGFFDLFSFARAPDPGFHSHVIGGQGQTLPLVFSRQKIFLNCFFKK